MSDNKLKTCILISALTLFGGMSSCEKNGNTNHESKIQTEIVFNPQQKKKSFTHIRDSIRDVNGYNIYKSQLATQRLPDYDEEDIEEIKKQATLGGRMTAQVKNQGIKIINDGYAQITSLLHKNNIYLDDVIESDKYEFNIINNKDTSEEKIVSLSKANMAFFGVGSKSFENNNQDLWVIRETQGAFDCLSTVIYSVIDESDIDINKKRKLKDRIANNIKKIQFDLDVNRGQIERKYSDYYLVNDYDKKHLGIDGYEFGYENLNYPNVNGKYRMTHQCTGMDFGGTQAYSLKSFLQDSVAEYTAIRNVASAYDIIKIEKNGDSVIKRVPLGASLGSRYYNVGNSQPNTDIIEFDFELDTNNHIQLYFDEITNVVSRKKDWDTTMSKSARQKIDSLNIEIKRKNELMSLILKTERHADSVANAMVTQKLNSR